MQRNKLNASVKGKLTPTNIAETPVSQGIKENQSIYADIIANKSLYHILKCKHDF